MKVKKNARVIMSDEEFEAKLRALPDDKLYYLFSLLEYIEKGKARYRQIWRCWRRERAKARKAEA